MPRTKSSLLLASLFIVSTVLVSAPHANAGASAIQPVTINGITLTFSLSYPDTFVFNASQLSEIPTSVDISATFNNDSISEVQITAVYIRLYTIDTNLQVAVGDTNQPPQQYDGCYAEASIMDPNPSVLIARPSFGQTSDASVILPLTWTWNFMSANENPKDAVQAKLFAKITFEFLDNQGRVLAIYVPASTDKMTQITGSFPEAAIYTSEGEAPYVTVNSPVQSQENTPLLSSNQILLLVFIALITAAATTTAVGILRVRKNRREVG